MLLVSTLCSFSHASSSPIHAARLPCCWSSPSHARLPFIWVALGGPAAGPWEGPAPRPWVTLLPWGAWRVPGCPCGSAVGRPCCPGWPCCTLLPVCVILLVGSHSRVRGPAARFDPSAHVDILSLPDTQALVLTLGGCLWVGVATCPCDRNEPAVCSGWAHALVLGVAQPFVVGVHALVVGACPVRSC